MSNYDTKVTDLWTGVTDDQECSRESIVQQQGSMRNKKHLKISICDTE